MVWSLAGETLPGFLPFLSLPPGSSSGCRRAHNNGVTILLRLRRNVVLWRQSSLFSSQTLVAQKEGGFPRPLGGVVFWTVKIDRRIIITLYCWLLVSHPEYSSVFTRTHGLKSDLKNTEKRMSVAVIAAPNQQFLDAHISFISPESSLVNARYVTPGRELNTAKYDSHKVRVYDARANQFDYTLDNCGFTLVKHSSKVPETFSMSPINESSANTSV